MARWNKYTWTDEQDAAIRRVYLARERGGNKRLARLWCVAPRLISARAAVLGLPPLVCSASKKQQRAFTDREEGIVRAHLGEPFAQIRARLYRAGFHRSLQAINTFVQYKRRAGAWPTLKEQLEERDRLTTQEVAAGMGVGEYTVQEWIRKGWLKHVKIARNLFVLRWLDLRAFLVERPTHWDHRKTDRWFLLDVLTYQKPGRKDKDAA